MKSGRPKRNYDWSRSQRIPFASEVASDYRSLGTEPPQLLGSKVLQAFAGEARRSVAGNKGNEARKKSGLLAMIYYELGQAQAEHDPRQASKSLINSLRYTKECPAIRPSELLRKETTSDVTRLLLARTSQSERELGLQQTATVREMGKIIVAGTEVARNSDTEARSQIYRQLSEIAFIGALLARKSDSRAYIAAPTTIRQNPPYTNARIGIQTSGANGINLVEYEDTTASPSYITRLQIKSFDQKDAKLYDPDIVVLADRDLDISSPNKMNRFGRELAGYDGRSSRWLQRSYENIDLAIYDMRASVV